VNLRSLNKAKCKILHLGWGNPRYIYRLGEELLGSIPAEKDLQVLVDKKLNMSQHWVYTAWKANSTLGYVRGGVCRRVREVIVPIYSAVVRPYGVLHPGLGPSTQERYGPFGEDPEEARKMIRGLELLFFEDGLGGAGLVSLGEDSGKTSLLLSNI